MKNKLNGWNDIILIIAVIIIMRMKMWMKKEDLDLFKCNFLNYLIYSLNYCIKQTIKNKYEFNYLYQHNFIKKSEMVKMNAIY